MQLTLREMERYRMPFLVWITVSAVAGVAGPFGTLDGMGSAARLAYWAATIGLSIALSILASRLSSQFAWQGGLGIWAGFVVLLSGILHGINSAAFAIWGGVWDWLYLAGTVALITCAVKLISWGLKSPSAPQPPQPVRADPFMQRLPLDIRGDLVRVEAQDHYLNVVTRQGSTLILMRLSDAMSELEGRGLQVHRSHWVAREGVTQHRRDKGRDILVMSDEVEVPVSRSFRTAAREAGLF
ncbi:MAG: LytTR family DNA-binding domain-containing protein [Sulfitobacter sp.]